MPRCPLKSIALLVGVALLARIASARSTIVIGDAWSRPAIDTGVVYLTIANHGNRSDRLEGATASVARAVEMHESMEAPSAMQGGMPGGIASMQPVAFVFIKAHASAHFRPGGYHFMLVGLKHELHVNETFPLRLHFARAGWLVVRVRVRSLDS